MYEMIAIYFAKYILFYTGIAAIWAKYGVWIVAVLSLVGIAIFVKPFRALALTLAVCLTVAIGGYTVGVRDGAKRVRAQWDKAVELTIKESEDARKLAENSVPHDTGAHAKRLPNDRYDRDNRKK